MHSITQFQTPKQIYMFGGISKTNNKLLNDLYLLDMTQVKYDSKSLDLPGALWNSIEMSGDIPSQRRGATLRHFPGT